jgi:hypothetical protein
LQWLPEQARPLREEVSVRDDHQLRGQFVVRKHDTQVRANAGRLAGCDSDNRNAKF